MQCITAYTRNSVHLNQIMLSTTTTVSLAAFRRNPLPLLILWRLSSGHCVNLRAFRSPTRLSSSYHSQAQHPKKALPASLCALLPDQACPNKIRFCWLSSRRRGPRNSRSWRSCRNAPMIPMSTTASRANVSYPNNALITLQYIIVFTYQKEGIKKQRHPLTKMIFR